MQERCSSTRRHPGDVAKTFKFNYQDPDTGEQLSMSLLGAILAPSGNDEILKRDLLNKAKEKCTRYFERLRLWNNSIYMISLLNKVNAASLLSFMMRCHRPELTESAARYVDGLQREVWLNFAEVAPTERNIATASLPARMGGVGLLEANPIRAACYTAAHNAFTNNGGETSQGALTIPIHKAKAETIDSDPAAAAHREDCCTKGNCNFITQPRDSDDVFNSENAHAALRVFMNAPHRELQRNDNHHLTCPGCNFELRDAEFCGHVRGCARVKGTNASTSHALNKKLAAKLSPNVDSTSSQQNPTSPSSPAHLAPRSLMREVPPTRKTTWPNLPTVMVPDFEQPGSYAQTNRSMM